MNVNCAIAKICRLFQVFHYSCFPRTLFQNLRHNLNGPKSDHCLALPSQSLNNSLLAVLKIDTTTSLSFTFFFKIDTWIS